MCISFMDMMALMQNSNIIIDRQKLPNRESCMRRRSWRSMGSNDHRQIFRWTVCCVTSCDEARSAETCGLASPHITTAPREDRLA